MKRLFLFTLALMVCMTLFSGCNNAGGSSQAESNTEIPSVTEAPMNNGPALSVPQELETIPEEYYSPAAQQGTLVELYYDTYESKTYGKKTQQQRSERQIARRLSKTWLTTQLQTERPRR